MGGMGFADQEKQRKGQKKKGQKRKLNREEIIAELGSIKTKLRKIEESV